jgi:hypothetical protein
MKKNIIPKNKIAIIPLLEDDSQSMFDMNNLDKVIKPLNTSRKRDWFTSNFYKCLPLSIGNMQGFVVSVPFEFDVMWNGGNSPQDIFIISYGDDKDYFGVRVESHFGNGIFTIGLPFIIKTPQKVNIMTIAPPNFPLPGLSPLSGVVETDNLKYVFTLNIKIDIPNTWIKIMPSYPLVGLLPIPRYFCDNFELIDGEKFFDKKFIENERNIAKDHGLVRYFLYNMFSKTNKNYDGSYFSGTDIRGNKFDDHQLPIIKKPNL